MSQDVVRVDCILFGLGLYEVVPLGLDDLSKLFHFFSFTDLKRARDWPGNGLRGFEDMDYEFGTIWDIFIKGEWLTL